jgi:hypothetical protein
MSIVGLLFIFVETAHAQLNLTGPWAADDGGMYSLRQIADTLWWAGVKPDPYTGEHVLHRGVLFTNVFQGRISGNTVVGEWADVPRGDSLQNGTLTLRLVPSSAPGGIELRRQSETGGFGGAVWTRTAYVIPACTNSDGDRVLSTDPQYLYCLFDEVPKNDGTTLLRNLKPYKDNVVVFGRMLDRSMILLYPANHRDFTCPDFFAIADNDASDGDIT